MSSAGCMPSWKDAIDYQMPKFAARMADALVPVAESAGYKDLKRYGNELKTYLKHGGPSAIYSDTWKENGFSMVLTAKKNNEKGSKMDVYLGIGAGVNFTIRNSRASGFPHLNADLFVVSKDWYRPEQENEELDKAYTSFVEIGSEDFSDEKKFVGKWLEKLDDFRSKDIEK